MAETAATGQPSVCEAHFNILPTARLEDRMHEPDDGFDNIALHFGGHVPSQRQVAVEDVVSATSIVVPNGVALRAVADRFLTVVTDTTLRET